jgi:ATP-dependent Lhr-like helicase
LKNSKKVGKIKVLYITPLRALNRDVFRRITKYAVDNSLSIEIKYDEEYLFKQIYEAERQYVVTRGFWDS